MRDRYEGLNRSREEFDRLTKQKSDLEKKLDNQKARLEAHITQIKRRIEGDLRPKADVLPDLSRRMDEARLDLDNLSQEEGSITNKRQELQQLRARYEALNYAREQFDEMTREKASLERTLDSLKAQIEAHTAQLKRRIEGDLRPKADALPDLTTRMDQGRLDLDNLAQEERGLEDKRQRLNGMASRIGELKAVTQQLTAEGLEIRSKLDMVQATHQDAQCPLCGTQLGPDGCERLVDNYTAQREEKGRLYRQNDSDLKAAEKEKADLDQELPKLEAALRRSQREAQGAMAVLQRQMEESTTAAAELESASRELAEESTRLEQGDFAEEERRQVAHLETRIMALGYDQAVHTRLYSEMQEMQLLTDRMEADLRLRERDAQGAVAVLQRQIEESTTAAAELDMAAGELAEERPGWSRTTSRRRNGGSWQGWKLRFSPWITTRQPIPVYTVRCRSYSPIKTATGVLKRPPPICPKSRNPWSEVWICTNAARRKSKPSRTGNWRCKPRPRSFPDGRRSSGRPRGNTISWNAGMESFSGGRWRWRTT